MLLDLLEGAVDGVVVGDVALDAEQALGRPGSTVGDGNLVSVGGQPLCDRQTDPRFPPVTSTERDTNAGLPPSAALSVVLSVAVSVTPSTYRLRPVGRNRLASYPEHREWNQAASLRPEYVGEVPFAVQAILSSPNIHNQAPFAAQGPPIRRSGKPRYGHDRALLGSEALSSGAVTPYQLRSQYVALHKDVYVAGNQELTASLRAKALWLRSRRRGVLAGHAAAVLHGARWIGGDKPVAIIDTNHRQAPGVQVWRDRIEADEIGVIDGMRVTTPDRTALDLASRYPLVTAVAAVDALMQATQVKVADVNLLAERYRGRRGIKSARAVLNLVDGGAQSPKETWLRLLLIRAGFPVHRHRLPFATNGVGRRLIWIWAGRTSRSPPNTTVTTTSPIATTSRRTFDDTRS